MLPNRVCADWQKVSNFCFPGLVLVKMESQWFNAETHCDQSPGKARFVAKACKKKH